MKRKTLAFACAAGLCVLASQSVRAVPVPIAPTMSFTVDGDTVNVPSSSWTYYAEYDQWEFDGWTGNMPNGDYLEVQAGGKVDPMLSYTFSPIDFGAPSLFTFSIAMPIAPTGPINTVNASLSGGMVDFTGNGVTFTPNPALGDPDGDTFIEAQVASVGPPANTNMGVDVGLVVSHPPSLPAGARTFPTFAAGPQPGPIGVFTSMSIVTSFTLSGSGDSVSLSGFSQIVPEPTGVAMLALGGLALARRTRRT